ncbi:MAG: dicarboxylate/amino acid:cation symporter [Ignavibacteria bacterium]|jgi:Na+/H+-dicarboxylate symporter|nr:dicarboxylate/amino acid:cation symporter [Ignavibacteria bacterium]
MKIKLPKLHNQILIALIAGTLFGSFFHVNPNLLIINSKVDNTTQSLEFKNWESIILISESETSIDSFSYSKNSQLEIIAQSKKILKEKSKLKIVSINGMIDDISYPEKQISFVTKISKEKTIATSIKWIGDIFIRLLNMIAIPLVLASLIVGAASLGDIKKFARIGGKTILFYISTTAFAIAIGLLLANIVQPGNRMPVDTKDRLMSVYQEDMQDKVDTQFDFDITKEIVNIIPKNPFDAMANSNMLQIVFFAVAVGIVLTVINRQKAEPVINFFEGLSEVMIKLVDYVMIIAPIGVFALIAATIGEFGFEILGTLIWYSFAVVAGLILHTVGVYGIIIKFFVKVSPLKFFKGIRRAQTIGFSTSSSAATLPVTMEVCQENLGISKSVSSFVLPLGATINMDGTALYQGVAAVFIAQVFGFELNLMQQLTIVFTAVLASIGTAPVPGVGIIMLIIILRSVGIPQEGIALILGVDRILDMCRTVVNVTGDTVAAAVIATSEKEKLEIKASSI